MTAPLPSPSAPAALPVAQDDLLDLFTEVNALAIQLKKPSPLEPEGDLAAAGRSVLQVLASRGPQTVPRIARLRATSRQNTQILVNRLVREGYLELQPNPDHKCSALVQLTEPGKALLEAVARREAKSWVELRPQLTPAELRSTTELLGRLRRWLAGEGTQAAPAARARRLAKPVHRNPETSQTPTLPDSTSPNPVASIPLMLPESQAQEIDLPVSLL